MGSSIPCPGRMTPDSGSGGCAGSSGRPTRRAGQRTGPGRSARAATGPRPRRRGRPVRRRRPATRARRTSTSPLRQLVTVAVRAVKITTSRLVPRAVSALSPVRRTRPGTMMIPPPTPSSPARMPAATPTRTSSAPSHTAPRPDRALGASPDDQPSSGGEAEDAEPELKRRDRRAGQQAGAQLPADDPADEEQESRREVDIAVACVPRRRRGGDGHDRQQARGAGPALVEGEPRHQQRNHDDAAADPEQPGEDPGGDADRGRTQPPG